MKEFFKLNNIEVGFANHSEVSIQKGKLSINLLTPNLKITPELHNGMLDSEEVNVDYISYATSLAIPEGKYNTQLDCPEDTPNANVFNFPENVNFYGVLDVQEGYIHLKGELRSRYSRRTIPVEIVKQFDPKPLIPPRTRFNLGDAKIQEPLEVYELIVRKGRLNEFPMEILAFENLESLEIEVSSWQGDKSSDFSEIPEALFELKNLHTLSISGSNIKTLSEKVSALTKLEELRLCYTQLKSLPNSLCDLKRLQYLSLDCNELVSLPENIGYLPDLEDLRIGYNPFTSLPKSLTEISNINLEGKHKKLFLDTAYKSKNKNEINESLFNLFNHPTHKTALEKAIQTTPELKNYKDFLLNCSTLATCLVPGDKQKVISVGASKTGGSPDLPKGWKHPADQNGNFYLFHTQINCEEIGPYQNYLPRKGMLYFFVSDEEYVEEPLVLYSEDENLVRIHYNEETTFVFCDDVDDDEYRNELAVSFRNHISIPEFYNIKKNATERFPKYAQFLKDQATRDLENLRNFDQFEQFNKHIDLLPIDGERMHSINSFVFTQGETPQEQAADKFGGEPTEWLVLLNMETTGEFMFGDAGTLTYCMHKKDLEIKDFSRIYASIESG